MSTILMIEDNVDDALLLQRELRRYGLRNPIVTYTYPEAAITHLEENYESTVLILLDLAYEDGHIDGYKFLDYLHSTPGRFIPVIIISGSEPHKTRAFKHGALEFMVKPAHAGQLIEALHKIGLSWSIG